ncbi:MAG: hypothetical protein JJ925_10080, partial [Parvibaculum sp.]|nr:hypothetical protein [Parvibaculum sp.]
SLPFREGKAVMPCLDDGLLETADMDAKGRPFTRRWEITDLRGAPLLDVMENGVTR